MTKEQQSLKDYYDYLQYVSQVSQPKKVKRSFCKDDLINKKQLEREIELWNNL